MTFKLNLNLVRHLVVLFFLACLSCNKDDDPQPTENNTKEVNQILIIENGSQTINEGDNVLYTAYFLGINGEINEAENVTWTVESNENIASFSNGSLSAFASGVGSVKASVKVDDIFYETIVPLNIKPDISIFTVFPNAVLWEKDGEDITLEPVYISSSGKTATYTFESSNQDIVSVSATGTLTFKAAGSAFITVTSSIHNTQVQVPVVVVTIPEIVLPIIKVDVTPKTKLLFKDEVFQYSAKAYNENSEEVSTDIKWISTNEDVATISNNGTVTAVSVGVAKIHAVAQGIIGEAEVEVYPNKEILVHPFSVSIAAGKTKQFTATTYEISRDNPNSTDYEFKVIPNPQELKWFIPSFGISIPGLSLDVATVDENGLVTIKDDAKPFSTTFLIAHVPENDEYLESGAIISVTDCDCGTNNPNVNSISAPNTMTIELFDFEDKQINATTSPVANEPLTFCSDTPSVVTVDEETGELNGVSSGVANITVCAGSITRTVVVTVEQGSFGF